MREYVDLYTVYGEKIKQQVESGDCSGILSEYPRPQMERESCIILNGLWDYAIKNTTADATGEYDGKILVPFSPECVLSGVKRFVTPNDTLFYRRTVNIPAEFLKAHTFINFGAVDYECKVKVNGKDVGSHKGGYVPFSLEITSAVCAGENVIEVVVRDPSDTSFHSKGKQKLNAGGIWYTAQSGIWQTVWLESLPENYVSDMTIKTDIEKSQVSVSFVSDRALSGKIVIQTEDGEIEENIINNFVCATVPNAKLWSPEEPNLYYFTIYAGEDVIKSYFAMRKIGTMIDENGYRRITLNNKPYFHNGLLDQGYWSDGMLTPPSDEGMIFDIQTMKDCGFNMLRKHIKLEPLRWYYHCDRLGMLVWQDMVNGGREYKFSHIGILPFLGIGVKDCARNYKKFARSDADGRQEYYDELNVTVETLKNFPCIAVWVPFNEAWGQFDANLAVEKIRQLDDTRLIDHASGWQDQKGGDFKSLHIYFKPIKFKPDKRVIVLSEFGGYSMPVDGHVFNLKKAFGYKKFYNKKDLSNEYEKLYNSQIIPAISKGLSATVYTQVTDVEDEINGLLTYDRKVLKISADVLREINNKVCL